MARVRYIPFDQSREDDAAAAKADRRALKKETVVMPEGDLERFGGFDPTDEEFASVEDYAQFLLDSERTTFFPGEIHVLNYRTKRPVLVIKAELEAYGFTFQPREKVQSVRGIASNPHDRWTAYPSHGGGGGTSINGIAGSEG